MSDHAKRLRLFTRGNNKCPICLAPFSKQEVELGRVVTLEHVPPRSFGLGGVGMCLTCQRCNNSASRAEQVAATVIKGREKVRVDVPGLPPLSAYAPSRMENGVWRLTTPRRADIPENLFRGGWQEGNRLGWYVPWFDATRGSWARMEPDFVARVQLSDSDARDRFLVIEFKGMKAGEPSEVAKQNYLETRWVPAVSRSSPDGDDYGEWRAVWIERVEEARDAITRACRGA